MIPNDKQKTLQKAGDLLMMEAAKLEGVSASLLALASDQDGLVLVSKYRLTRALELLADACDQAVHKLGTVYSILEAVEADGDEGGQQEGENDKP